MEKEKYILGIDLATIKTGVVLIKTNKQKKFGYELVKRELMELLSLKNHNLEANVEKIKAIITPYKEYDPIVFVELGNYGNAFMTIKFALYSGVILSIFPNAKFISPHNWQKFLTKKKENGKFTFEGYKRDQLKYISKRFTSYILETETETWTEDECDAFCIAFWGEHVETGVFGKLYKKQRDYEKIDK